MLPHSTLFPIPFLSSVQYEALEPFASCSSAIRYNLRVPLNSTSSDSDSIAGGWPAAWP